MIRILIRPAALASTWRVGVVCEDMPLWAPVIRGKAVLRWVVATHKLEPGVEAWWGTDGVPAVSGGNWGTWVVREPIDLLLMDGKGP